MKFVKYLFLPLAFLCFNTAMAFPKSVIIPFTNVKILDDDHSGLVFNYNMAGEQPRKVICKLTNVYKSWVEFSDRGAYMESGTYGGHQTVILTAKGRSGDIDDDISMFHADADGIIKISDTMRPSGKTRATASCYYRDEK